MLHFTIPEIKRCTGKTAHQTIKAASKELKRNDGKRMKVFKCDCGFYHIGHSVGARVQSLTQRKAAGHI